MSDLEPRLDDIVPVTVFVRRYPELGTETAWRWRIFNAESNGLAAAGAIKRVSGRVLLVTPRIRSWILSDGKAA